MARYGPAVLKTFHVLESRRLRRRAVALLEAVLPTATRRVSRRRPRPLTTARFVEQLLGPPRRRPSRSRPLTETRAPTLTRALRRAVRDSKSFAEFILTTR